MTPYLVMTTKPIVIVFSGEDFHYYALEADYAKKHGKYALQRDGVTIIDALSFTDGDQSQAVQRVDRNELRLSGRALMQLVIFDAMTRDETFESKHFDRFFEVGNSGRNAAKNYLENVAEPILNRTPLDHPSLDSVQRYSIRRELEINAAFWQRVSEGIEAQKPPPGA